MLQVREYRREFLGNVSHELKPLFTVQGYISTLLDGLWRIKLFVKKYLNVPKKWKRLIYIVEDLDMITKLESGLNLEYTDFDIVELIQNVFDLLEMKADKENYLGFRE
jgi:two-component system phosphate regulon sensor histidine kinase PhoR